MVIPKLQPLKVPLNTRPQFRGKKASAPTSMRMMSCGSV